MLVITLNQDVKTFAASRIGVEKSRGFLANTKPRSVVIAASVCASCTKRATTPSGALLL
jgi:hypothetical protein